MNDKCRTCGGLCCFGIIDVYSSDDVYYEGFVTIKADAENDNYDRQMRQNPDGSCICLVNGKCSIYERRPIVCRAFKVHSKCCNDFWSGKKTSHACKDCIVSKKLK